MIISCVGPHITGMEPTLGSSDVSMTTALCDVCGQVYVAAITGRYILPGIIPDKTMFATVATAAKIAYDKSKYKPPKVTP